MITFIVISILCLLILLYYLYRFIKKYSNNNTEVDFRNEDGKMRGYRKNKNGNWVYDETLYLEDGHDFHHDHDLKDDH